MLTVDEPMDGAPTLSLEEAELALSGWCWECLGQSCVRPHDVGDRDVKPDKEPAS